MTFLYSISISVPINYGCIFVNSPILLISQHIEQKFIIPVYLQKLRCSGSFSPPFFLSLFWAVARTHLQPLTSPFSNMKDCGIRSPNIKLQEGHFLRKTVSVLKSMSPEKGPKYMPTRLVRKMEGLQVSMPH